MLRRSRFLHDLPELFQIFVPSVQPCFSPHAVPAIIPRSTDNEPNILKAAPLPQATDMTQVPGLRFFINSFSFSTWRSSM